MITCLSSSRNLGVGSPSSLSCEKIRGSIFRANFSSTRNYIFAGSEFHHLILTDDIQVELSTLTFTVVFVASETCISSIVGFVDVIDCQLIASDDKFGHFTGSDGRILHGQREEVHQRFLGHHPMDR
jgi:hypothetical protein